MVTVHIPAVLRDHSGGRDRVEVSGRTLRQVFDQLEVECPGIKEHLLDEEEVHSGLAIVVDDEITGQGLIQPVPENATILILPALSGGSLHDSWRLPRSRSRRSRNSAAGSGGRGSSAEEMRTLVGGRVAARGLEATADEVQAPRKCGR